MPRWLTENTSPVQCMLTKLALGNPLYTVQCPILHVDNVRQDIERLGASFRQHAVIPT
jgi:hypothetical protein